MASELGEHVTRSLYLTDSAGNAVDADSTPTWSVVLPDGTAGASPGVLHGTTGDYYVNYLTTQYGMNVDSWSAVVGGLTVKYGPDMFMVRNSALAPLIGLQEARRHLRLSSLDATRDDQLRDFIDAATELCEDYVGRTYRRQTFTESFDGGKTGLLLSNTPVLSVTTVTESGAAVTSTGWVLDTTAYTLTRGTTAAPMTWIYGRQNITVTYVAGVTSVPARVRQAVKVTLAHLWATQRGGSNLPQQVDQDEYSPNAAGWSLPRAAEQLLLTDSAPGFG